MIPSITPRDLHPRYHDHVILDVREPFEVELASLPDALHIPMHDVLQHLPRLRSLAAERPLVVVCHHGLRSAHVCHTLAQHGLPDAINLTGGIDAWSQQVDPSVPRY